MNNVDIETSNNVMVDEMRRWYYFSGKSIELAHEDVVVITTDDKLNVLRASDLAEVGKFDMKDLHTILVVSENSNLCLLRFEAKSGGSDLILDYFKRTELLSFLLQTVENTYQK